MLANVGNMLAPHYANVGPMLVSRWLLLIFPIGQHYANVGQMMVTRWLLIIFPIGQHHANVVPMLVSRWLLAMGQHYANIGPMLVSRWLLAMGQHYANVGQIIDFPGSQQLSNTGQTLVVSPGMLKVAILPTFTSSRRQF